MLRVVTWNVLSRAREQRLDALLTELRRIDPDVVLLQETSHEHARAVAQAMDLQVAALAGTSRDDNIPATLTRLPAELQLVRRLPGAGHFVCIADVATELGPVRVTNMHLQHTERAWRMALAPGEWADDEPSVMARLAQLEQVRGARASLPAVAAEIVGGDLNCVPGGPEHAALVGSGLRDAAPADRSPTILAANPLVADSPEDASVDYTLDFQFHTPALGVRSWVTIGAPTAGQWVSDHLGIVADYEFFSA